MTPRYTWIFHCVSGFTDIVPNEVSLSLFFSESLSDSDLRVCQYLCHSVSRCVLVCQCVGESVYYNFECP